MSLRSSVFNLRNPTAMIDSTTAYATTLQFSSVKYPTAIHPLEDVLKRVVPDVLSSAVEEVDPSQLARIYTLILPGKRKLLLSLAPSPAVRLLRHETAVISSEAMLLQLLRDSSQELAPLHCTRLQRLSRNLLHYSSHSDKRISAFSISEITPGTPISMLLVPLHLAEQQSADKQLGSLARSLASIISPNDSFGPVSQVLSKANAVTPPAIRHNAISSWSEAFCILLEGVLRDAEDMCISLPYESLRAHVSRHSRHLNAVTIPRLLILDGGSDINIMLERKPDQGSMEEFPGGIQLTGLRSWSLGIFGDPLLSDCFDNPSESFWEGWREGEEDVIEDPHNVETRLLLYGCFRAVMKIVTQHYRPQMESGRRELEGRRTLKGLLAELDTLEEISAKSLRTCPAKIGQREKSLELGEVSA